MSSRGLFSYKFAVTTYNKKICIIYNDMTNKDAVVLYFNTQCEL